MAVFSLFCGYLSGIMSIAKEIKIGLLATVALVILFVGFYFLKGAAIFSNEQSYYCYFKDVDGLQNSAAVQVRGLNVGRVSRTQLIDNKGVLVRISINKSVEMPKGTIAELASDLLGPKIIKLELGPGPGLMGMGDTLATHNEAGVIDKVSDQLTPRLAELKETIAEFNRALVGVNSIVGEENQKALGAAIASIKTTADNLSALSGSLNRESGEMGDIIHNAKSITGNLSKNNDTINHILANASNLTRQLSNAPIQKTMADLQKTIGELHGVMDKINNNQGSLGMLINNKDVYNNLNSSLHSLNGLMEDIKAHPSHYINVTVFGSGSKK